MSVATVENTQIDTTVKLKTERESISCGKRDDKSIIHLIIFLTTVYFYSFTFLPGVPD